MVVFSRSCIIIEDWMGGSSSTVFRTSRTCTAEIEVWSSRFTTQLDSLNRFKSLCVVGESSETIWFERPVSATMDSSDEVDSDGASATIG